MPKYLLGLVLNSQILNFYLEQNCRCQTLLNTPGRRISSKIHGGDYMKAEIVRKKGKNVLNDPLFNKGLGFPRSERDRLGVRGLLPSQM